MTRSFDRTDTPARSNEWVLLLALLLGANTAVAALAWFLVGLFFE
jgi:hypothetical protein